MDSNYSPFRILVTSIQSAFSMYVDSTLAAKHFSKKIAKGTKYWTINRPVFLKVFLFHCPLFTIDASLPPPKPDKAKHEVEFYIKKSAYTMVPSSVGWMCLAGGMAAFTKL